MTISKNGANILSANSKIGESEIVDSQFTLAIRNTEHLNRLLSEIRKVKAIQDVQRIDH
jgi:GTP pyrophosphokinase